jgi:hypothetical protein
LYPRNRAECFLSRRSQCKEKLLGPARLRTARSPQLFAFRDHYACMPLD